MRQKDIQHVIILLQQCLKVVYRPLWLANPRKFGQWMMTMMRVCCRQVDQYTSVCRFCFESFDLETLILLHRYIFRIVRSG